MEIFNSPDTLKMIEHVEMIAVQGGKVQIRKPKMVRGDSFYTYG